MQNIITDYNTDYSDKDKNLDWFMRLTLVNINTGKKAFAMYPCSKYLMFESLYDCGLPYGSGDYIHLAYSANGVPADSIQCALAGIITNPEVPPSIMELNYLGERIQDMSRIFRDQFEHKIKNIKNANIIDAINVAHEILSLDIQYNDMLSNRAVLMDNEAYIMVYLVPDSEEVDNVGAWLKCPASEDDLKDIAQKLGVESYYDLRVEGVYSILSTISDDMIDSEFVNLDAINNLAFAMQTNDIVKELGKFAAILDYEACYNLEGATDLANKMMDYEFHTEEYFNTLDYEDIAFDMGFDITRYGAIRRVDNIKLQMVF